MQKQLEQLDNYWTSGFDLIVNPLGEIKKIISESLTGETVDDLESKEIYQHYQISKYGSWPFQIQAMIHSENIPSDAEYLIIKEKNGKKIYCGWRSELTDVPQHIKDQLKEFKNLLPPAVKIKSYLENEIRFGISRQAYFCAKAQNEETSPQEAIQFARKLGYELWIPKDKVTEKSYPIGAMQCKQAIEDSDVVICVPPIGNDCSWELGYAVGLKKKIYILGTLPENDWMTKINLIENN